MRRFAPIAFATLSLLPSCSLLGLASFPILECNDGLDCEPVNDRHHIGDEACARWVCDPMTNGCVFGVRDDDGDRESPPTCGGMDCDDANPLRGGTHAEVCDGIDNDCDLAIDDLPALPVGESVVRSQEIVATIPGLRGGQYGSSGESFAALAFSGEGVERATRALLLSIDGPSEGAPTDVEHRAPLSTAFMESRFEDSRCPVDALGTRLECDETEGAIAGNGASWAALTIGRRGCGGAGELHIAPLGSNAIVTHQGPSERSHIWFGVGTSATVGCTTSPSGVEGARAPALVALEGDELLATYVADAVGETCEDDDPVEVEALGLWLIESGGITWVEGTGSGVPTAMGTTRSIGGARIAPWVGHGWLIAFGDAAGGVALRLAGPMPMAPPMPVADAFPPTGPLPRADLPTIGTGSVERVAIAIGQTDGNTAELGVAYQEGCGDAHVHFVRVAIDLTAMTADPIGASIDLGVGEEPAIAYVGSGIRVDDTRSGGFAVLFVRANQMELARFSDATGEEVGERIGLGPGLRAPTLYPGLTPAELRYAYEDGEDLVGGTLFCPLATETP